MNRVLEVVLLVLEIRLEVFPKPFQHKATPKTLFVFSVPIVLIGDSPPPAVRIEALLGDQGM